MTFRQLLLVILIEGENRNAAVKHGFAHWTEIALRQRENHLGWLDLRQYRERIDVGGVDDVADVDLTEPDHAVDRRNDGGEIELCL